MYFEEAELMTDDPLKLVKFLFSDIFQSRFAKIILKCLLLIHGTISAIQIYFSIYFLDAYQFIGYGPIFFGSFYGQFGVYIILTKNQIIDKISEEVDLWSIDSTDRKTQFRLRREIKIIVTFTVVCLVWFVLASGCFMAPTEGDKRYFFAIYFFENYFEKCSYIPCTLYRASYPLVGYIMLVHVFQTIYYTQHMKFQIIMLLRHTRHITNYESEKDILDLYYDEYYQKEIHRRLKFGVKRHVTLLTAGYKKLEQMDHLLAPFILFGCLVIISLAIILIFSQRDLYEDNVVLVRFTVMSLVAFATASAVIFSGQTFEDETYDGILALCETKWYSFNYSNKSTYLISLTNAMKPFQIKFLSYCINFEMTLKLFKAVYAGCSLMLKIKNSSLFN